MSADRHGIGRAMERRIMELTESWLDWTEPWQPPRGKFAPQDIWGLFDYLAISDMGTVVAVQVCRSRKSELKPRQDAIREWCLRVCPAVMPVVISYHERSTHYVIDVYVMGVDGKWVLFRSITARWSNSGGESEYVVP